LQCCRWIWCVLNRTPMQLDYNKATMVWCEWLAERSKGSLCVSGGWRRLLMHGLWICVFVCVCVCVCVCGRYISKREEVERTREFLGIHFILQCGTLLYIVLYPILPYIVFDIPLYMIKVKVIFIVHFLQWWTYRKSNVCFSLFVWHEVNNINKKW